MTKPLHVSIIVTAVIVLDQVTKYLVSTYISPFESVEIFPFLHLLFIKNKGAAFGMFRHLGSNFFIGLSFGAIIIIIYLLKKSIYSRLGLSLVLGGAIGNLIDRIRFGEVVDFIDVSIGDFHWLAFNIADTSLTIGISVIFLLALIKKE